HQALERGQPSRRTVHGSHDGVQRWVELQVEPSEGTGRDRHALVVFRELDSDEAAGRDASVGPDAEVAAASLEQELRRAREQLAITLEDRDITIEELRSSNEELQSINEQYRSALEEMETSQE